MAKRFTDTEKWRIEYFKRIIFEYDKWLYLNDWDVIARHLINLPAVYVIYINNTPVYIGQSNTPRLRFGQHAFREYLSKTETPWGLFDGVWAKIKYPKKYGREAMIEKRLIKKLKPKFNKYHYRQKNQVWA